MTSPAPAGLGYSSYVRTVTVLDPAGSRAGTAPPVHLPSQVYLDDLDITAHLLVSDSVGPGGRGVSSPAVAVESRPEIVVTLGLHPAAVEITEDPARVLIAGREVLCPVDYARYVYAPAPANVRAIGAVNRLPRGGPAAVYVRMYAAEILFRAGNPPT